MARSIPQMLEAGFDDVNVVYMLVEEHEYEQRLRAERIGFTDFTPRVIEGVESFDFATRNIGAGWLHFVESSSAEGGKTKAARKVIDIVRHSSGEFMTDTRAVQLITGMQNALHRVARDVH